MFDHSQVVGDEQVGQPALLLEVMQQIDDLRLHRNIQSAHRLVADDQLRFNSQCTGNTDALALSATELMRIAQRVHWVETDGFQQFRDSFSARFGAVRQVVNVNGFANDFACGHAWVQRAVGILKNHLQLSPPCP